MVRRDPQAVKNMLRARAVRFDLDALLEIDQNRRRVLSEIEGLRAVRNRTGREISEIKKSGMGDASEAIARMGTIISDIERLSKDYEAIESSYYEMAMSLPNIVERTVPVGPDDASNREVGRWGAPPKFDFDTKNHIDIAECLDLVDLKRASKVAGSRFYYMKGDLARLNYALIRAALDFLAEEGYVAVQPPYMINKSSMKGAVIADDFEEAIYKIEGEDLYMIGTSEHAIAAMHTDEILDGKRLPLRYGGVSPCFRREAGAHGRDQKGIFRVHQFEKIEQFVFARPEDSWREHERMRSTAERFYQRLKIPYRTMLLSSGDMGKVSAKTYDLEAWMAGQNAYREIVSCSNCLDYQARRLKIRFRDRTNDDTTYVHTLNSTLVATTRVLVAIMENMQRADGSFVIPDMLVGYMGGQKEIGLAPRGT